MPFGKSVVAALLAGTLPIPTAAFAAPPPGSTVTPRGAATRAPLTYSRFVLPNGLTVLVHTNRRVPNVFVGVYYKVGSKDEPRGRTGFAHLFEHLMFQQTANRPTDYFTPLTPVGATDASGSTLPDYTEYHQTVPTNALDLALWLESDRMGYLAGGITQAVLDEQRAVVKNEKRQNHAESVSDLRLRANYYPAGHPYAHDTIGSMADLDAATLATVKDWFHSYYGAANAVLVLSGDVDEATARAKVAKYFADVSGGPRLSPPKAAMPAFATPKRVTFADQVPGPTITRVWPIDPAAARDLTLLPLIEQTMTLPGVASLRTALVDDAKVAVNVGARLDRQMLDANFTLSVMVRPGVPVERAEAALDAAIARYVAVGPEQARLDAIGLATKLAGVRALSDNAIVGDILAGGEMERDDPGHVLRQIAWNNEATSADLRTIAARWLTRPYYQQTVIPGTPEPLPPELIAAAVPATASRVAPGAPAATAAPLGTVDRTRMPDTGEFKDDVVFPAITETVLPNGLRLVVAERHDLPIVDAVMQFSTGALADSRYVPGTTEQAFAMMTAGTTGRDQTALARAIEQAGMLVGGSRGARSSSFGWTTLSDHTAAGFALAADMLRRPAYPEAKVTALNAAAKQGRDSRQVNTIALLANAIWGQDDPAGRLVRPDAIRPLTRATLADFHAREIGPNNATLVVMGDITPEAARRLALQQFGDWRKATPTPLPAPTVTAQAQGGRVILIDIPGAEQSMVSVGQPVAPYDPARRATEQLMDAAFSSTFDSRVNTNLRETKGWTYGIVGSIADAPRGARLYNATGAIETAQTAAAMAEIRREMTELVTSRPITAAELEHQRASAIHAVPQSLDNAGKMIGAMIAAHDHGLPYTDAAGAGDRLAAVTLDQVNKLARETYRPGALTWVVAGDRAKIEAGIRALNLGPVEIRDGYGRPVP